MMGQLSGKQDRLFYSFNLNDRVPADHMLPRIDRYLDVSDLHQHLEALLQPHGPPIGRPRVAEPDAAGRLLLRDSLGATVV